MINFAVLYSGVFFVGMGTDTLPEEMCTNGTFWQHFRIKIMHSEESSVSD